MATDADLTSVLARAQALGFMGPGSLEEAIAHARRFGAGLSGFGDGDPIELVDIGAGGGLPALPLLVADTRLSATLVDAAQRRVSFLAWAGADLGLADRVEAVCARAEEFAHEPDRRGRYDVAIARGFGPPAWTLECAVPLVRPGGRFVVSEPPGGRAWPLGALAEAGVHLRSVPVDPRAGVAVFEVESAPPAGLPRSPRRQRRAPLFDL
ncbi:MAG: RsmG family class I SAM-dependent methyltransferase [Actinomycetota bacterium]